MVNNTTLDMATILQPNYNREKKQLSLDAISSEGGSVTLKVHLDWGFAGTLVRNSKLNKYKSAIPRLFSNPPEVGVISTGRSPDIGGKGG